MMRYIISQFGQPRGPLGALAGKIMARSNQERNNWLISLLDVQPADNLLEIGYGPGTAIQQVAGIAKDGIVAGIDHSETMLRQASRLNATTIQAGRVKLLHGSVETIPFEDNTFDKVYTSNSIQFWPEPIENLKQLRRVMKPGGRIAIALQPRWAKTDAEVETVAEEIKTQLTSAGFNNLKQHFKPMKPVTCFVILGTK